MNAGKTTTLLQSDYNYRDPKVLEELTALNRQLDNLKGVGYDPVTAAVPEGEKHKSLDTVSQYYDALLNHKLERRSPVRIRRRALRIEDRLHCLVASHSFLPFDVSTLSGVCG